MTIVWQVEFYFIKEDQFQLCHHHTNNQEVLWFIVYSGFVNWYNDKWIALQYHILQISTLDKCVMPRHASLKSMMVIVWPTNLTILPVIILYWFCYPGACRDQSVNLQNCSVLYKKPLSIRSDVSRLYAVYDLYLALSLTWLANAGCQEYTVVDWCCVKPNENT